MSLDEEFQAVYQRYSDKIYRFLYFHTKDLRLAEDLTSEVFLRVWKNWPRIKQDYTQALLYKVANNILIDHWRKHKNRKNVSYETSIEEGMEPSYDEEYVEKIARKDDVRKIRKAIELLPDRLKQVIILRFIEDMSAKETAEIMEISEINVRVLQHRALVKLKEIINHEKGK